MYRYSYVPPRDIKKSSLVSLAGFVLGFALMALSNILPFAAILQILGIAVLALTIFFATRYVVRSYVYATQQIGEGDYDIVINEIRGKSSKVVCRINADEIIDFIYSSDGKTPSKYAGKNGKDILCFDYCQNFMPGEAHYLYAALKEGKICIKFSPDKHLVEIIEALRPKGYGLPTENSDE